MRGSAEQPSTDGATIVDPDALTIAYIIEA